MKAIILAGGEGTRLRPLSYVIPKPLLPIGTKPILEIIIERLRDYGFTDIILNTGYKSELIEAYFREGKDLNVNITYYQENKPWGTAGPIKFVEHLLDSQPFLTMNGDLLTDLDFNKMYQFHIEESAELTVAVTNYSYKVPYGVISMEGDKIASIDEKPELKFIINAGIYIVSPSALDAIPKNTFFDMTDLIQTLVDQERRVKTYYLDCKWQDVGNIETYEMINAEYFINKQSFKIPDLS